MKKNKQLTLILIFIALVLGSGYLCTELSEYKYWIFYSISMPSIIGLGVCCLIAAFTSLK
jgi:hypothetical protein